MLGDKHHVYAKPAKLKHALTRTKGCCTCNSMQARRLLPFGQLHKNRSRATSLQLPGNMILSIVGFSKAAGIARPARAPHGLQHSTPADPPNKTQGVAMAEPSPSKRCGADASSPARSKSMMRPRRPASQCLGPRNSHGAKMTCARDFRRPTPSSSRHATPTAQHQPKAAPVGHRLPPCLAASHLLRYNLPPCCVLGRIPRSDTSFGYLATAFYLAAAPVGYHAAAVTPTA